MWSIFRLDIALCLLFVLQVFITLGLAVHCEMNLHVKVELRLFITGEEKLALK